LSTTIENNAEIPLLRIKFKIYPPQVSVNCHRHIVLSAKSFSTCAKDIASDPIVYRFLRDSWNAQLEAYHLLHLYEVPLSTRITALIQRAIRDMETSPFRYQFKPDTRPYFSHETLKLQLLEFVNRGVPCPNDGQVQLRCVAHREDQTIQNLATDRYRFAIPTVAIEGTYFVIHASELP